MRLISLLLAFSLASSPVFAADSGPLAPGASAGVKKAQMSNDTVLYLALGAAAVAAIAVGVSGGSGGSPAPGGTTTTTTTTTTTS